MANLCSRERIELMVSSRGFIHEKASGRNSMRACKITALLDPWWLQICSKVLLLLLIVVLPGRCIAGASSHQPKNVNVGLRAKWSSTPLLLEAGELLAKHKEALFWSLVEQWHTQEFQALTSEKECFDRILALGKSILNGPLESVFHFSLLLRSASPKIVLYRQLAQESLFRYGLLFDRGYSDMTDFLESPVEIAEQIGDLDRWSVIQNPSAPQGQCCWVDVGTHIVVDTTDLFPWLDSVKEKKLAMQDIEIFDFDHIYPGSSTASYIAILYGSYGTACFQKFHSVLVQASRQGIVKYAFRPVLLSGCEGKADKCALIGAGGVLNLAGYGVELALKNMEYKTIDDSEVKKGDIHDDGRTDDFSQEVRGFIFSKLLERKPELAAELMTFRDNLLSSGVSDTMNVWELKDLGYQAAQRIIDAGDPLQLMQEISQNFPNLVSSLSRMKLNKTIKEEIAANQRMVAPGRNLLALNGALVNLDNFDLYSLIDLVDGELSLADSISKSKVPSMYIKKLMQIPDPPEKSSVRLDFRSDHVHYLNNLEEDHIYRRWRSNLNELLMPVFPGQLRYIRKNLYHAVYVIDPASPAGLKVVETIMYYYANNVPMRFGLILFSSKICKHVVGSGGELPVVTSEEEQHQDLSSLAIRLFLFMKDNYGIQSAFQFLNSVNDVRGGDIAGQEDDPIETTHLEEAFIDNLKSRAKSPAQEILLKLEKGADYKEQAIQSTLFVYKLGLSHMHPCLLMNGLVYGPSQVQSGALTAMNEELPKIQEGVYHGHINSQTDILDKFLKESGHRRYNLQIIEGNKEEQKHVSLSDAVTEEGSVFSRLHFLHSPGTDYDVKPITHLIVLNLFESCGFQLLKQAIRYLIDGSDKGRVGFMFNIPAVSDTVSASQNAVLIKFIRAAFASPGLQSRILPFLEKLISWYEAHSHLFDGEDVNIADIIGNMTSLANIMGVKLIIPDSKFGDLWTMERVVEDTSEEVDFLASRLGIKPGDNAVITNGKVFLQKNDECFVAEDFLLLESVEYEQRVKAVEQIIERVQWDGIDPDDLTSEFLSTVVMAITSAMALRSRSSDIAHFAMLNTDHSAIVQEVENASIHVDAIIDPLSSTGQKLSPLLLILQKWFQPSMRILLNPMNSLADLPLKNFYRFVVPDKDHFQGDGGLATPIALFLNMPATRTLTVNVDVPETWLVEPVEAVHDLDNLVLETLENARTMYAVYELEAIVLTGHCFERNNDPPRGLQLRLGTNLQSHMVDTIVMANLGYWQLKAAPGVWSLGLVPGKSTELYTLCGSGGNSEDEPRTKRVVIKDLRGELVRLEVCKKRGKENEKLLGSDEETEDEAYNESKEKSGWNKNILKWASGLLGSNKQSHGAVVQENLGNKLVGRHGVMINIFSIASGHVYERFLKIMMLSVLKNTRRPVKFWFIKNYLSPKFKEFIPHMAKEYGFEYDLITYKWPTWLHKQTEKQRIIWAYKILFLDVIFPLSLKKVIFVDADQVVRADMGELYDMDLRGRPYAYTPFCDNNKEMDGYRFWNQGFWKDHLRGKPYHISALYVVDLAKFRHKAAGDTLRVIYETLSKDPGSLANLDQDLPNYSQHMVPIYSLPQEWLWCESWCGNGTKSKAKTIDLCNNPMTKEPKLHGARRIVAEWPALDDEARQLTARIFGEEVDLNFSGKLDQSDIELPDVETAAEL